MSRQFRKDDIDRSKDNGVNDERPRLGPSREGGRSAKGILLGALIGAIIWAFIALGLFLL